MLGPNTVLEGHTITSMLEEHADTFDNMESYATDLLEKRSIAHGPKAILKMMLIGWTKKLGSAPRSSSGNRYEPRIL